MRDWNKEPGSIVFQRHGSCDLDTQPDIIQADPVVLVDEMIFDYIHKSPWVSFHDEDYVTFNGINRSVTYRVGEYDFLRHVRILRWPD